MDYAIIDLNDVQIEEIDSLLEAYDNKHIQHKIDGSINIGVLHDGNLIAGVNGCMTAYKIFYVSTVFVDEKYRGQGIGRELMRTVEVRAASLDANIIRLDTFNWQGLGFYLRLGYEQVGYYESKEDGFSEHFLIKRLKRENNELES